MADKHWWFEGATVRKLGALLTKYPDCRLEVRIDKAQSMTLTVASKPTAKTKAPPRPTTLNFSHVCPGSPGCPD